jgi:hypothetical protein
MLKLIDAGLRCANPALYCGFDRDAVDLRTLKSDVRNPYPALGITCGVDQDRPSTFLHSIGRYLWPGLPVARIHKVDLHADLGFVSWY